MSEFGCQRGINDPLTALVWTQGRMLQSGSYRDNNFSYEYDADGTGIVIAAYLGNASTVEVPASIDGTPIVEIGEGAFEGNSTLVSVDLPDSVEIIGVRAFAGCTALNSMQ